MVRPLLDRLDACPIQQPEIAHMLGEVLSTWGRAASIGQRDRREATRRSHGTPYGLPDLTRDGVEVPHGGGPAIHFHAELGRERIKRLRVWQTIVGMTLTTLSAILLVGGLCGQGAPAISLLSKFPAYSPFSAISGWPGFTCWVA